MQSRQTDSEERGEQKRAGLIQRIDIRPSKPYRVVLGSFTEDNPAKGFSIQLSPNPTPAGSVITEVMSQGTAEEHKLTLHIANHGTRTVSAEIWQL